MPIVSLHSIDAGGKATQTKALIAALHAKGWSAEAFDFPHYESTVGQVIGRVLRGETLVVPAHEVMDWVCDVTSEMDAKQPGESYSYSTNDRLAKSWSLDKAHIIQSLMVINRLEYIDLLARCSNRHSYHLGVFDRYILDAIAYGQIDGLDRDWLVHVHRALPQPSIAIVIDITVEESMRRRPERRDYYEKDGAKLEKVRAKYLEEAELGKRLVHPDLSVESRHVVNGMQPVEAVTADIMQLIEQLFADGEGA